MELRLLRYFLAVAETEHFGRAAEQLHMAAPPLSRAIRQLEHEVGAQLFTRDTRQVRLTEAGRVLQREASLALAGLEDTVDRVRRIGAGKVGVIRLGVTGSATYGVLALCGGDDVVCPPDLMAEVADGVPYGRLVVLPEVGHLAPAEDSQGVVDALSPV